MKNVKDKFSRNYVIFQGEWYPANDPHRLTREMWHTVWRELIMEVNRERFQMPWHQALMKIREKQSVK